MSKYIILNGQLYHADDELMHYGVPGMRWGHRKSTNGSENSDSRSIARKAKRLNEFELKAKRKAARALTISELFLDSIVDRPIRDIVRAARLRNKQKQLNEAVDKAKEKGFDVDVSRKHDIKTGKTSVDAFIKDRSGNTFNTKYEGTFNPGLKRKKK